VGPRGRGVEADLFSFIRNNFCGSVAVDQDAEDIVDVVACFEDKMVLESGLSFGVVDRQTLFGYGSLPIWRA
jgi:hypothetical protein